MQYAGVYIILYIILTKPMKKGGKCIQDSFVFDCAYGNNNYSTIKTPVMLTVYLFLDRSLDSVYFLVASTRPNLT